MAFFLEIRRYMDSSRDIAVVRNENVKFTVNHNNVNNTQLRFQEIEPQASRCYTDRRHFRLAVVKNFKVIPAEIYEGRNLRNHRKLKFWQARICLIL